MFYVKHYFRILIAFSKHRDCFYIFVFLFKNVSISSKKIVGNIRQEKSQIKEHEKNRGLIVLDMATIVIGINIIINKSINLKISFITSPS